MNNRLKQFIAAENITQAQFADRINVVRASVSHILAGRNKPGYEFISGLMRHYPNLNMEWLMLGKGKMYKDSGTDSICQAPEKPASSDIEQGYGDLFEETLDAQESKNSPTSVMPAETSLTLNDIKTLINNSQKPVIQRKLVKITAFFDDGTFQELASI